VANPIRPGRTHYCTATKTVVHGAPCTEQGFAGIAIKKIVAPGGTGLGAAIITTVQIGEKFHIETRGEVEVTNSRSEGGTFAKGDAVYIIPATNLLTAVSTANVKFGRVTELGGEGRGLPTGSTLCRIVLDARSGF
jgi:hypothetical protein